MNKLQGKIVAINQSNLLTKIEIKCHDVSFTSFAIDFNNNNNKIGSDIAILFKESEVGIAKNFSGEISFENRFACKVQNIQIDKFLTQITLSFFKQSINSIISSTSARCMNLKIGDTVMAFVQSIEIILMDNTHG